MNSNLRIVLVLSLLGIAVVAYNLVNQEPGKVSIGNPESDKIILPKTDGHGPLLLKSSADCAPCHQEIYDEWKGSHHEFAWLNPEPRRKELSNNFRNKDCIPCHAPRPLIEVGYGDRALERETRREDGVNCFTCHKFKNVMAAANDLSPMAKTAPCNPVPWQPVSRVMLCSPCHDQHKVEQDWLRSKYSQVDSEDYKDCNDCHMPITPGPGTKGGSRKTHRGHGFKGGHDAGILKTAGIVRAVAVKEGDSLADKIATLTKRKWQPKSGTTLKRGVLIEVKNTGTGHNFPSDERHRAVDLYARFLPKNGKPQEAVRLARFRNPYRNEFENINPFKDKPNTALKNTISWAGADVELTQVRILPAFNPDRKVFYPESTQLHAGESRFLWFELPDWGGGVLELTLYYKLQPYLSNEESTEVGRSHVSF